MKFAHFSHVWGKPGMTPHQRYEELWRELQLCDGLGYDYAFCVEHHFRPDESWISSPSVYIVGAAARTRKIRVGSMGYIVPLYHPLRLAEEIALVDQMIGGRMELGLVPGINADYFKPFGFDYNLRKSPTLEFVEYLRAAYGETQPFSFHGEVHNTDSAAARGAAGAKAASAALDDEPRSADARILRAARNQPGIFSGLSARRCGAALSQVSCGLGSRRSPAAAEDRLLHHRLCRRIRPEGARRRVGAGRARL